MIKRLLNGIRRQRKLKMLRENRRYWHKVNAIIIGIRLDKAVSYLALNTSVDDPTPFELYLEDLLLRIFDVEQETDDKLLFQVVTPKILMPHAKVLNIDDYSISRKPQYKNRHL